MTRRRFLGLTGGILAGAAGLGVYAWRVEPHWFRVIEHDLPIADLPDELAGKTLLQLSDLHAGALVDTDYLIGAVRYAASLQPDLTVITGDFMTCKGFEHLDTVARVLEHLQPGPLGCYGILGNHDYTTKWTRGDVADRLCQRVSDFDICMLRNECRTVAGLQILGMDDYWGTNFAPLTALARVDKSKPVLTLCHNPDTLDIVSWGDHRGWILAGHTHGGQCKPPFLPPPVLPVFNKRYTAGEIDLGDGRLLYINRGLGYVRRIRCNVRPEITVHRLLRACPHDSASAADSRS